MPIGHNEVLSQFSTIFMTNYNKKGRVWRYQRCNQNP